MRKGDPIMKPTRRELSPVVFHCGYCAEEMVRPSPPVHGGAGLEVAWFECLACKSEAKIRYSTTEMKQFVVLDLILPKARRKRRAGGGHL